MADDAGHVLRATLNRPTWFLPRWSKLLLALALVPPLYVGAWAVLNHPGDEFAELAAYEKIEEDLVEGRARLFEAEGALDADRNQMRNEMGLGDTPPDVEGARDAVRARWGQLPYSSHALDLAAWCMSGETDPTVVKCEREGEWITGEEASFILFEQYGALRPIKSSRRAEISDLLRMREADYLAAQDRHAGLLEAQFRGNLASSAADASLSMWTIQFVARSGIGLVVGLFLICFAFVGGVSRSPFRVEIRQNGVRIDKEWINGSDIVGCFVEGRFLVIRLLGGERRQIGPMGASQRRMTDVAEAIAQIGLTPNERVAEAQARMDILRRQSELGASSES